MRRAALVTLALIVLALAWLLRPLGSLTRPEVRRASSYGESLSRLERLAAADTLALHAGCETTALLHGARTPRAIVLLHGITNCPLQFLALGRALHELGDNVLIPRIPHHGLADRMSEDLATLEAGEIVDLVAECVGIAGGLGDTVVVAGLSISGVAAAWAGQDPGVGRAVAIAPAFAPPWRPAWIAPPLTRLALRLPNAFVWWDDEKRQALEGPRQCYFRFSTRAMAQGYRLGEEVMRPLRRPGPEAASRSDLVVVTTEGDEAVDNARAGRLAALWAASGRGPSVRAVEFPAALGVVHDMIDPVQVGARTEVVYPVLIPLIRGESVPMPRATSAASGAAGAHPPG